MEQEENNINIIRKYFSEYESRLKQNMNIYIKKNKVKCNEVEFHKESIHGFYTV